MNTLFLGFAERHRMDEAATHPIRPPSGASNYGF